MHLKYEAGYQQGTGLKLVIKQKVEIRIFKKY